MINISAKKVAFGGAMVACSAVILYIASVIPTAKLAVCLAASAVICIVMMKYGAAEAVTVYLATFAISLVISNDKTIAFGYLLFFGNYPVIKAFIEKIKNLTVEWIVKIILFVIYTAAAFAAMNVFFAGIINFPYPKWIIFALATAAAGVYDVALSLFISEINRRFSKFI